MLNAYCFCPEFLVKYIDSENFLDILTILNDKHSIILDAGNLLWLKYTELAATNPDYLYLLTAIESKLTDEQTVKSNYKSVTGDTNSELLLNTLIHASTTEQKILTSPCRFKHKSITAHLSANGIHEVFPYNFSHPLKGLKSYPFNLVEFRKDLIRSIYLTAGVRKGKHEDEYNDLVANCLKMNYTVQDQTRHGSSLNGGPNLGSLDLVIEDRGHYKTIIEPLKLKGGENKPFYDHYKKLLLNYNPFLIKETFLVVYYIGGKQEFNHFCATYSKRLAGIDKKAFTTNSELHFGQVDSEASEYPAVKIYRQQGLINGSPFHCTHILADFSE